MKRILLICVFSFLTAAVAGAGNPQQKQTNFFSFSIREKKIDQALESRTPNSFKSHPDYGLLPCNAPCENCVELIDHRDATSRYFVEQQDGGKRFYKQQSLGAMNYQDESGWWREINYRLKKKSAKIYEASQQPSPVKINLEKNYASIVNNNKEFRFNKNLKLYYLDQQQNKISFGVPNWNHYFAGDDGILFKDFYPGIDLQMIVSEGKLKTNFILNNRVSFHNGWIVISQQMELPSGMDFDFSETKRNEDDHLSGEVLIAGRGKEYFRIHSSLAYDAASRPGIIKLGSEVTPKNELLTYIPLNWLDDARTIYPVVIDPMVSSTDSLPQLSIGGSQYNASCWTGGCTYNLSMLTPANCTITGINFSFDYAASGSCTVPDGGVSFDLGTCRSPAASAFTCPSGGIGTCSLTNYSMYNDFASCISPPQCIPYIMDFTMHFYRCNNDVTAGCSSACIAAASAWIVTIIGETVQVQPGSLTANQLICQGDTAVLFASAQDGVSPYSFSWNPVGLSGDTIRVTPTDTTQYQLNITDACGEVTVDSVTVFVVPNNNPGFTVTSNPSCAGQNISLAGLGSGPASNYDWLIPGSATPVVSNSQFVSVIYSLPGSDTVTLNYSSGFCVFPSRQIVAINSLVVPSVNMNANSSGIICRGDSVLFTTVQSNGGVLPAYQWLINGATVAGASDDTVYLSLLSSGNNLVEVVMTSDLNCASPPSVIDSVTLIVAPNTVPSVAIQVSPNDTVCTGDNMLFTAQPINEGAAPFYQWQVNGTNAGGNSSSFSSSALNTGDSVSVTMTSNALCALPSSVVSIPLSVTVRPFVAPSVSITSVPADTICIGTSALFQAIPVNGGPAPGYQWKVNGNASGANNAVFSSASLSEGDVVSTVMTSNEMCLTQSTATSNQIIIHTYPQVSIAASSGSTICPMQSVTLQASASGGRGAPYNYFWSDGAGTASTVVVSPSVTTNYFVYATDICNSTPPSATVLVTVLDAPVATFSYEPEVPTTIHPEVTFTDLSENAIQWLWDFGDGKTSTEQNPVHSFNSEGTYEVTLLVTNVFGCADTSAFRIIMKEEVVIFVPNSFTPNDDGKNDTFTPLGSGLGDFEMIIYDRWGNEIFTGDQLTPWTGAIAGSSELAPGGIYTYRIEIKKTASENQIITGSVTLLR